MRRKRRAALANKPPIEFLKSPPIHVPLRPATPVHSSLCPLTASVVPVGEIDNVWVNFDCICQRLCIRQYFSFL
jgi:hypothetical protein